MIRANNTGIRGRGKFTSLILGAGLIALCGASAPAHADLLNINDVEFANGYEDINITNPISDSGQETGEVQFTGTDLTTQTSFSEPVWCVDIYHEVYLGGGQNLSYTTAAGPLTTDNNGGFLSAAQSNEISWLIIAGTQYMNGAGKGNALYSAALQTAIWAIEYPSFAYNTAVPNLVNVTNSFEAEALSYSSGSACKANNSGYCAWDYDIILVNGGSLQSFAGFWNGQGNVPQLVPEPGSLALLGGGLLALAALGSMRSRRRGTAVL